MEDFSDDGVDDLDEVESIHGDQVGGNDDSASLSGVKKELRTMNIIRTFAYAIMITLSTIASQVVYVVVRMNEENKFKAGFEDYANDLIESFYQQLQVAVTTAESLSQTLTVQAHAMNANWPYVTLEGFDTLCAGPLKLTGASAVTMAPLIFSSMQQSAWERYATYVDKELQEFSDPQLDDYSENQPATQNNSTVFYYDYNRTIKQGIYHVVGEEAVDFTIEEGEDAYGSSYPVWHQSPNPQGKEIRMYDQISNPIRAQALLALQLQQSGAMTNFLVQNSNGTDYAFYPTPNAALYYPIFAEEDPRLTLVGSINFNFQWASFLEQALVEETEGVQIVVESSCGREHSFRVKDFNVTYVGEGAIIPYEDREDYEDFDAPEAVNSTFTAFAEIVGQQDAAVSANVSCQFRLRVYASMDLYNSYLTSEPDMYQAIVLAVFLATICIFGVYDCSVEKGSNRVVESARRTDALVSTLFPAEVKHRLLEDAKRKMEKRKHSNRQMSVAALPMIQSPKLMLQNLLNPLDGFLSDISGSRVASLRSGSEADDNEPIADLFPDASVMFADIAGFTAWSSEREPTQVFKLLETLYRSMDAAARKLRVFKVETIGDCYVAATGLPEQREDHVEAIARFAKTSLIRTSQLTRDLEATLGPGTGELALRFGIHSGPVTAGVLRGEKARFQLFGDTMNFAARMESTGIKNKVHLSAATADMLVKRGKPHWVMPREETVYAKGKGELQTYWLQLGTSSAHSVTSCDSRSSSDRHPIDKVNVRMHLQPICEGEGDEGEEEGPEQVLTGVIGETQPDRSTQRLVEWNTGALSLLLKRVVAYRQDEGIPKEEEPAPKENTEGTRSFMHEIDNMVIPLPEYNEDAVARVHEEDANLPHTVQAELRMYVAAIASGYKKNAFHNFEHASHVLLSATKLLKRITYADGHQKREGVTTRDLHQFTCGISSDPLTQFAVVFAALIHDVGHTGVSNEQMAKEMPEISALYEHKSIAEQRSVDVALELLNLPKYRHLRRCICATEGEKDRFRQLLLHCVLATDIFEKDLKAKRNQRWAQAFPHQGPVEESSLSKEDMNRKATIVLEHIIQASDVAHTMQHWHIYIKWNERLFHEMHAAYKSGRTDTDPAERWYEGELWFFDNYVIPLAKKLKECGVFGVSSDEYLNYAQQNRIEWEQRGQDICKSMMENFHHLEELSAKSSEKRRRAKGLADSDKSANGDTAPFKSEEFGASMRDISYVSDRDNELNRMDASHRYTDH